jgi:hypothetical protein
MKHLPKIQNGRHKQRSGQHTLAAEKYTKKRIRSWNSLISKRKREKVLKLGSLSSLVNRIRTGKLFENAWAILKFPNNLDPHERQFICSGRQCSGSGSVCFSAFSIIPRIPSNVYTVV